LLLLARRASKPFFCEWYCLIRCQYRLVRNNIK
jgi:hypothetical protein